jgi:hypothetical protein
VLTTGAKVGLGLGIPLGLVFALALFFFIRQKRRGGPQKDPDELVDRSGDEKLSPLEMPTSTYFTPELPSLTASGVSKPVELE